MIGRTERRVLAILFVGTCVCFGLGLFLPILTMSKLFIFDNTVSVTAGIVQLASHGNWLLAMLLLGFSVVLPLLKLVLMGLLLLPGRQASRRTQRWLERMHDLGRWAMLDVLVVAVIMVSVKLGAIARVEIQSGLYFFGGAVILMMILTHRLAALYRATPTRIAPSI